MATTKSLLHDIERTLREIRDALHTAASHAASAPDYAVGKARDGERLAERGKAELDRLRRHLRDLGVEDA